MRYRDNNNGSAPAGGLYRALWGFTATGPRARVGATCGLYHYSLYGVRMNIITDKLNTLKAVLELIDELDNQKDFIGKSDVDGKLRWTAKNIADKIYELSYQAA